MTENENALEIYQKWGNNYDPHIKFTRMIGWVTKSLAKKLGVRRKDSITFSKHNGILYLCVLPELSEIKGLKLFYPEDNSSPRFCSTGVIQKFNIKLGNYELDETPTFINGIDWFELIWIEDQDRYER